MSERKKSKHDNFVVFALVIVAALVLFNQVQLYAINNMTSGTTKTSSGSFFSFSGSGGKDLKNVDVNSIQSTAQAIAAVFPVNDIKTADDAIQMLIPTGTPEYGEAMGVSFDEPVKSLDFMAGQLYRQADAQIKSDPEKWQRYINLASEPRGVSCEYCCGVGPAGIDKSGRSKCGCQHNPALLGLTEWLLMNTEYTDAEILREVMKWKTLFFPKNMLDLALKISGGDTSVLESLPGMVGGC
ncbi:hypothetical protein J4206_02475 [Candidatus Woesearchaeota archaeon]|nr:hypothetical protein [Candidatus Woesearchaeota archaeon]